jgi:DNA-binding CsgD family transcriptional regulator
MEQRPGAGRRTALYGRADECALLDALVDAVRGGESRSLILRGEAGIGKTALLEYLIGSASNLTVVRAVGVESEMELAYASLHQLCAPMLDRLSGLPGPQRRAFEIVFGLSAGAPPDRFVVALAALSLFSEVAEERPLLCVVDDAQWLDNASALTLAFVVRRLLAEAVGVVFAARQPGEELTHVPELEVRGLRNGHAHALLRRAVQFRLDERVRDRIVAETRGNPLALLELPRGLTAIQLAGGFGIIEPRALSVRIEESFIRRLETLSDEARRLLLVAAAEPLGEPLLVLRASEQLGIVASSVDAETDGLVAIGERVIFRHPLVRSAVYRSADVKERRAVHLALADATDREADPDRRAWHLGAAAAGPDEQVALELERSAGRAQARGGVAAAAAFLERAAALTENPARRAKRALAAAQASVQAGAFDAAHGLLASAEADPLDEFGRALIDLLRAQLAFASSRGTEATPLLLAAARRLEPLDLSLARETYLDAFSAALFGARLNRTVGSADVAHAARAAPRQSDEAPRASDLLLDALVALTEDYDTAIPLCRKALDKLSGERVSPQERLRWLWQGCVVALEAWDDASAYVLSSRSVEIARETGTLSELALALSARTPVLVFCGELSAAASTVAETQSVEAATGIRAAPYGALILEAWQGKPREARTLIETTIREVASRGEGIGVAISEYARAVLCNGLGQYEEALVAADSARGYREVVAENWGLSELIEPAARTRRTDLATDAMDRLARKARATGTDWALGIEARSRALLRDGAGADDLYREAIERLGRTRLRPELARSHLLYGEWLRREHRRVDARAELRTALDEFRSIGMHAFAERARAELVATGEKVPRRAVETRDELTAQERQIAELAREGLSNPEIGERLFLSPRTVEWHLRKVFGKLGIRSRTELRRALGSPAPS